MEINITGAVGSSFLTNERDKSNGSQQLLKFYTQGGVGTNTQYLRF